MTKCKFFFLLLFFFILKTNSYANVWTVSLGIESDLPSAQEFSEKIKKTFPNVQICLNSSGEYIISDGTVTEDTTIVTSSIKTAIDKGYKAEIYPIEKNKCFGPESFLQSHSSKISENPVPLRIKTPKYSGVKSQGEQLSSLAINSHAPGMEAIGNGRIIQDKFVEVYPDIVTSVWLSNRDVNRIVCEGGVPVADVIYSEEKGITHRVHNDTVWLKYVALESSLTRELKYRNEPTELYVLCGAEKKTYAMVVSPQFINTQKIILKTGNQNLTKNQNLFKGLSTEEKILLIIKEAYSNSYPDSYSIKKPDANMTPVNYSSLVINPEREIKIHGEGLRIAEFIIWNNPECESVGTVYFDEKTLLSLSLRERPLLISIENHQIPPGYKTRAFIVDFEQ
ncbi:MAG: type-F conjugative transfer system secretin TraK [Desulforegulaceae bacterium]|nr:type-F conjugative transfer system secretin TraK [Desulforegulaceae bacterium]